MMESDAEGIEKRNRDCDVEESIKELTSADEDDLQSFVDVESGNTNVFEHYEGSDEIEDEVEETGAVEVDITNTEGGNISVMEKKGDSAINSSCDITSRTKKRRNSHSNNLDSMSGMEILAMEENSKSHFCKLILKKMYGPLAICILWLLLASLFYAFFEGRGMVYGLLMSVNVGWSLGWMIREDDYETALNKLFTIYHTTMGVMFVSVMVLKIAEELGKNRDNWILQIIKLKELSIATDATSLWRQTNNLLMAHLPKLRVFIVYFLWLLFGLLWYGAVGHWESWTQNVDFLASTLTGGGYMAPDTSDDYNAVVTALYTTIGVPLQSIALGLFFSMVLDVPEDSRMFEKIIAPVSEREIKLMQAVEIDDGDGLVDFKEFIILAAVRIGAVSPDLIKQISGRFRLLDRKHEGRISNRDILARSYPPSKSKNLIGLGLSRVFSSSSLLSGANNVFLSALSPNNLLRATSFKDVESNISKIRSLSERQNLSTTACSSYYNTDTSRSALVSPVVDVKPSGDLSVENDSHDCLSASSDVNQNDHSDIEIGHSPSEADSTHRTHSSKISLTVQHETNSDAPRRLSRISEPSERRMRPSRSKSYRQLLLAGESMRKSIRDQHFFNKKSQYEKMLVFCKSMLTSSHASICYVWLLWLVVGTVFYALVEDISICKAMYVSTSIGYGIFWYDQTSNTHYTKAFTMFHFFVGVVGVALVMALFARSVVQGKKKWHAEAIRQHKLTAVLESSLSLLDKTLILIHHHWHLFRIHLLFFLWMIVGIVWGVASIGWSILDAWLFAVTAMATGGLVSLPSDGSVTDGDYVFVSIYIIVGAPLMAISCGIAAHAISSKGRSLRMEKMLHAPITEDELVMMEHLGIENNDGFIDRGEFVILCLVRVGALNSDLIDVLFDRFWDIDVERKGAVTYDVLKNRPSFSRRTSSMPQSFRGYFVESFTMKSSGSDVEKVHKEALHKRWLPGLKKKIFPS